MSLHSRPRFSSSRFSVPLALALCLAASGLATSGGAQIPSLADVFRKGKAEFKIAAYASSLATFQKLDELTREPDLEKERAGLAPLISFYRAANLAALGREEEARTEFEEYLSVFPRADLDRGAFPKAVVEAFLKARESIRTRPADRPAPGEAARDGIRAVYARFRPAIAPPPTAGDRWVSGPVRYLMTRSERFEWDRLREPAERAAFIVRFWQSRDPNPDTPENEFRAEFERRIAFADAYFTDAEKRGSESDRGLVFALLGAPAYIAQFSLTNQDDPVQVARAEPVRRALPAAPTKPQSATAAGDEQETPLTAQKFQGVREIWHYGRGDLPPWVPFKEIDFEFLTKPGYGTAVLQRDQPVLLALEAAAQRDRSER